MPLKINVGLSRKIGEPNYSSRGGNVHFEVEAEANLVANPDELHARIRYLFRLAEAALEEQLAMTAHQTAASPANDRGEPPRATPRQRALIDRLAAQREEELEALLMDVFDTEACEHLSRVEASRLIDILQAKPPMESHFHNGNG